MAYIPTSQLRQFDLEEKELVTSRWETKEGETYQKYISKLIRDGGGQHLLQWDFQNGKYGTFLKSENDLRGFKFWKEDIQFPRADNIYALDFSYSNFWHSIFRNACWSATHSFTQFYNCKFIDCQFHYSSFLGCRFEKCEFVRCDFIQGCRFINCDFENSSFNQLFTSNQTFTDCRFSSSVVISSPREKPNDKSWNISFDKKILKDFYISLRDAYQSSGAHDEEWDYYYLAKHSDTRYNSRNFAEKIYKLFSQEYLMGYGEKPLRCLLVSLGVVLLFSVLYMYVGFSVKYNDSSGNVITRIVAYNINFPYFFQNIFNLSFHTGWLKDFVSAFYFNILTFTSVGTSEIAPINAWGRFFLVAEVIFGVILVAAWLTTLFRKLIR